MHTFAKISVFNSQILSIVHVSVGDQCALSGQCQDTPWYSAALGILNCPSCTPKNQLLVLLSDFAPL